MVLQNDAENILSVVKAYAILKSLEQQDALAGYASSYGTSQESSN